MQNPQRRIKTDLSGNFRHFRRATVHRAELLFKVFQSPSIYTVAPICKALGISLDEVFGISERLTRNEETLQARNDELERHVDAKEDMIEIMRRGVHIRNAVIFILFVVVVLLTAWCVYVDLHCADYGFWRGR